MITIAPLTISAPPRYMRGAGAIPKAAQLITWATRKNKRDVDPEQAAEIPGRQIDDDAIEEQHDGAAGEKAQASCQGRAMKP